MSILLNKHQDLPIVSGYSHAHGNGGIVALRENLSKNLERLLKAKGLTQKKLAKEIGLSQGSISGWITQRDWPEPENLDKVVRELGIQPEDLFRDPTPELAMPNPEAEFLELVKMAMKKTGIRAPKKS